jgi:glycosyltransferase involved in cell wall biosynthesis
MKNKMLEAMAMGKAIVATRSAASGLSVGDGREMLLREDDRGLAEAVIGLMGDSGKRRELGAAARRYVENHHSWEQTGRLMDEAYARTVAAAEGRPSRSAAPVGAQK